MLVKKEKLKRFLETKNLFKEKFAALDERQQLSLIHI